MRLIDADALVKKLDEEIEALRTAIKYAGLDDYTDGFSQATFIADNAPTIEAKPVKHGRWEIVVDDYDCEMMRCSVCGEEFYDGDNDTIDILHNFCPHCGAKMDGEGRDTE